jgi:hypothetical protein
MHFRLDTGLGTCTNAVCRLGTSVYVAEVRLARLTRQNIVTVKAASPITTTVSITGPAGTVSKTALSHFRW